MINIYSKEALWNYKDGVCLHLCQFPALPYPLSRCYFILPHSQAWHLLVRIINSVMKIFEILISVIVLTDLSDAESDHNCVNNYGVAGVNNRKITHDYVKVMKVTITGKI